MLVMWVIKCIEKFTAKISILILVTKSKTYSIKPVLLHSMRGSYTINCIWMHKNSIAFVPCY